MPRLPAGGGPRAGVRCPDSIRAPGDRCGSRPRCRRETRPYTSTVTRSDRANTACMSCSTSRMLYCRRSPCSSAVMASDSCWLMPAMGSSSSSRVGRQASTMASSSWRSSPCASAPAGTSARRPRPAFQRRAGRFPAPASRARRQKRSCGRAACTAMATFSSAVKGLNTEVIWYERASPRRTRVRWACGSRPRRPAAPGRRPAAARR